MKSTATACLDRLSDWVLGLPWVVERPGMAEAPGLRWFAVDCGPLGRRRVWLLTGTMDNVAFDQSVADFSAVHVVLPEPAARQVAVTGEGRLLARIGVDHSFVSLRLDAARGTDNARLESLLLLGYEASFI